MKRTTKKHKNRTGLYVYYPKYPNAASREYKQKALDAVTAVVSVIGFLSAVIFLFTMC